MAKLTPVSMGSYFWNGHSRLAGTRLLTDTAPTFHVSSELSWTGAQVERQCHPSIHTPVGQKQPYVSVLQQTSTWLTAPLKLRGPFTAEDGKN